MPKLPSELPGIALRFLSKQVIDCPVDPYAGLEMLILPGQIESQTRIPIAANLCVDYFLGIQHAVANTIDRLVLVHIAGCIVLIKALAQLLLLSDAIQRAGAHHSQKNDSAHTGPIRRRAIRDSPEQRLKAPH